MDTNERLREKMKAYGTQLDGMAKVISVLTEYTKAFEDHKRTFDGFYEICRILGSRVETPSIKADQYSEIKRSVERITEKAQYLGNSTKADYWTQLSAVSKRFEVFDDPQWKNIERFVKLFNAAANLAIVDKGAAEVAQFEPEIIEAAKDFDLEKVEVTDESVVIGGVEYTQDELAAELEKQIDEVKESKKSLYDRVEGIKKEYYLLFLILTILMALPEIPEKLEFYKDAASEICEFVVQSYEKCQTIKENAKLRAEPTPQAPVLMTVPLHTRLEILESVPRWHQVKYIDQNQEELRAWVSKVSVETEE
ncbi:MAG: SH3 domain-containing protein [Clostridia bacterium]|nr:SH3 domain-containing protein [Clostridia bacterium]